MALGNAKENLWTEFLISSIYADSPMTSVATCAIMTVNTTVPQAMVPAILGERKATVRNTTMYFTLITARRNTTKPKCSNATLAQQARLLVALFLGFLRLLDCAWS